MILGYPDGEGSRFMVIDRSVGLKGFLRFGRILYYGHLGFYFEGECSISNLVRKLHKIVLDEIIEQGL